MEAGVYVGCPFVREVDRGSDEVGHLSVLYSRITD